MSEKETKKRVRPSHHERWEAAQKAGPLYIIMIYSLYAFMLYLYLKAMYLFIIRDLSVYRVDWWSIPLCIGFGCAYWFINEWLYKKGK